MVLLYVLETDRRSARRSPSEFMPIVAARLVPAQHAFAAQLFSAERNPNPGWREGEIIWLVLLNDSWSGIGAVETSLTAAAESVTGGDS